MTRNDPFFNIVMEARGRKSPASPRPQRIKAETPKNTSDYTEDTDNDEELPAAGEEADAPDSTDDEAAADYTEESGETEPDADDDNEPPTDGDDEDADDYTEGEDSGDGDGTDPDADGEDPDAPAESDEDSEASDYTAEDGADPESEEGSGDGSEETPDDADTNADSEQNRKLLKDFTDFYYLVKSVVDKLASVNRPDILGNKVINQVKMNLGQVQSQIVDYLLYGFTKTSYVKNLYKYNFFVEAFRINVEMLKKIGDLISNE